MSEYITLAVVTWALVMVGYLTISTIRRADSNHQRSLDCLMSLIDKEAAMVSTQVQKVREVPTPNGREVRAQNEVRNKENARNKLLERLEHQNTLSEDDMRELESLS
jgi:type I site-specific restriction endonuclease